MGASASGGLAGSWIGAIGTTFLVKNPMWGALIGGTSGSWIGNKFGERTAEIYYEWKFAKLDEEFGKYLYRCYGIDKGDGSCLSV
jgi:hypothetical protein